MFLVTCKASTSQVNDNITIMKVKIGYFLCFSQVMNPTWKAVISALPVVKLFKFIL